MYSLSTFSPPQWTTGRHGEIRRHGRTGAFVEPALSVDLGTSNTVAMVRDGDGDIRTVLFDGSPTLPSGVFAQPGKRLLTGRDALFSARADPERLEAHPKLRIDDTAVWLGAEVTVVEMLAAVLRRVVTEAGTDFTRVTLTHPADWDGTRRGVLSRAAAQAGLGKVRLVPEPVAAAHYFADHGGPVAVYDFGAGTFDVSVVAGTRVLAADGLTDLGGLDIDEAIVDALAKTVEADEEARRAWSYLRSPRTSEHRRAWRRLAEGVRTSKETLSRIPETTLTIPLVNREVPFTRVQLEAIAEPLIRRTVATTRAALTTAGLTGATGIFLVGGASRMPLVAVMLHRILGIAPTTTAHPDLAVARGALKVETAATPAVDPLPPNGDGIARDLLLRRAAGAMRAVAGRELATVEAPPPAAAKPVSSVWFLVGLIAAATVGAVGLFVLMLWNSAAG